MDARVIRTRSSLTHALFELIREKRWERITVQDLLDRTGVSRSTFYAHYDNKLDVLASEIPDVTSAVVVSPHGDIDLGPLFEHVDEMAPILFPLLSQPVLGEIAMAFENGLRDTFGEVVDEEAAPYLARFIAGALIATIRTFAADGRRPAAADVAAELNRYVDSLLACWRPEPR